jgi:heme O synthase-like polyprenyltransferase
VRARAGRGFPLLRRPPDESADEWFALKTFNYSILYLMALFAFLLIDHYLPQPRFGPVPMVLVRQ